MLSRSGESMHYAERMLMCNLHTMRMPLLAVLLACACILAQGDDLRSRYQFATGQSMQFMGDSCSLKYYPSKSANCTDCFLFFKLGALSELDAYGQPISAHILPDLSKMTPEVASGKRMSGDVQYEYVTMMFSGQTLAAALTAQACPTLEAILNQAQHLDITQDPSLADLDVVSNAALAVKAEQTGSMGQAGPGSNATNQAVPPSSSAHPASNSRRLAAAAVPVTDSDRWLTAPDCNTEAPSAVARDMMGRGWSFQGAKPCAVRSMPADSQTAPHADPTSGSAPSTAVDPARLRLAAPELAATPKPAIPNTNAAFVTPVAVAAAPLAVPLPLPGAAFTDPSSLPYLKVTFMFGFTTNKTFPYGQGYAVTAPAGSIAWTLELKNWPFCSPYNTLKLELVAVSNLKDNQAQFVFNNMGEPDDSEGTAASTAQSNPVPAVRRLQSAAQFSENYGTSFFDPEQPDNTKRAAAGLPMGPLAGQSQGQLAALELFQDTLPTKKSDKAKLLVGPGLAAAIEMPTYAFSSSNLTGLSSTTTVLASNNTDGAARFSLAFGYFTTGLYYNAIMHFADALDMNLAQDSLLPAAGALSAASCPPGDKDCTGRAGRRKGSNNAASTNANTATRQVGSLLLAIICISLLH